MAVGGRLRGRKPPNLTARLNRRRIQHGCFWAILGPSTVDLVAGHGVRGVGGDRKNKW